MGHEIDLDKYIERCDLISEKINNNKIEGIGVKKRNYRNIFVEEVDVNDKGCKKINKKVGKYITIYFEDITDYSNRRDVINALTKELTSFIKKNNLLNKKVLVVGLGNNMSTPDSLGPKTISSIIVTRHLFNIDEVSVTNNYSNVSILIPGVYASTGIESFDTIKGVIDKTLPDYLIIIDSLASSSIEHINKTIQLTNTGIEPGSGIGNIRKELSFDTLGIPVIAIGVPTVVDAVTIVNDTISYLIKKLSYDIKNINNPIDKLKINNNYLNINYTLDNEERKRFLGLLGELENNEIKELLQEVLSPIGYNLMVTPKEIDFMIEKLAIVLSSAINNTLHKINE